MVCWRPDPAADRIVRAAPVLLPPVMILAVVSLALDGGIGYVSKSVSRGDGVAAGELGDVQHALAGGLERVGGKAAAAGGDDELFAVAEGDLAGLSHSSTWGF